MLKTFGIWVGSSDRTLLSFELVSDVHISTRLAKLSYSVLFTKSSPCQIVNFWPAVTAKGVGIESNTISGEFPWKQLTELTSPRVPGTLRFADQLLLELPMQKLKSIGLRAFSVCTPYLWDFLPFKIKSSASVLILTLSLRLIFFGQPIFRFLTFSLFRTFRLLTFSIFRVFFIFLYLYVLV